MSFNPKPEDLAAQFRSRTQLVMMFPWLSAILSRFILVPVEGIGDEVSCDREYRLYFDPRRAERTAVEELNPETFHEAVHRWGEHHERMDVMSGEHGAKNIAADKSNNSITFAVCAEHPKLMRPGGVVIPPMNLAPDGTHKPTPAEVEAFKRTRWVHPAVYGQPIGLTAEEYLALDKAEEQKRQQQQQRQGQGQQGQQGQQQQGSSQGGEQPSQQPQQGQQPGQGGAGRQPPGRACASCVTQGGNAKHRAMAEAQHGELPEGPNEVERQALRVQVAEAVKAHEATHGRGSLPAGVRRIADGILAPPKVDWRRALRAAVRGAVTKAAGRVDYTYGRRSKIQSAMGNVILPGLAGPQVDVAIVADTSGSMGADDLRRVGSETRGVLREAAVQRVWWVPTDSTAADPTRIRSVQSAMDRLVGGGGTDMGSGLAAVGKVRPRVAFTVVITDGDTGWPAAHDPAWGTVLIALTRPSSHAAPAWAKVLHAY